MSPVFQSLLIDCLLVTAFLIGIFFGAYGSKRYSDLTSIENGTAICLGILLFCIFFATIVWYPK